MCVCVGVCVGVLKRTDIRFRVNRTHACCSDAVATRPTSSCATFSSSFSSASPDLSTVATAALFSSACPASSASKRSTAGASSETAAGGGDGDGAASSPKSTASTSGLRVCAVARGFSFTHSLISVQERKKNERQKKKTEHFCEVEKMLGCVLWFQMRLQRSTRHANPRSRQRSTRSPRLARSLLRRNHRCAEDHRPKHRAVPVGSVNRLCSNNSKNKHVSA